MPDYGRAVAVTEDVFKLVATVFSRVSIKTLCDAIDMWNHGLIRRDIPDDHFERQKVFMSMLKDKSQKSLYYFCKRAIQVMIKRDHQREVVDGSRASTEYTEKLKKALGVENVKAICYQREFGMKWMDICGHAIESEDNERLGLMFFIPPYKHATFGITATRYQQMKDNAELRIFLTLIDNPYMKRMCSVAAVFLEAILKQKDVKVGWEGKLVDWAVLTEEEVLNTFQIELVDDLEA